MTSHWCLMYAHLPSTYNSFVFTSLSYYISLVLILHLHLSTYFLHLYCTYISLVLQPLLYLHLLCTYYIFLLCLHLPCTYIFLLDLCLYFTYICCYSPNSHTSLSLLASYLHLCCIWLLLLRVQEFNDWTLVTWLYLLPSVGNYTHQLITVTFLVLPVE